MEPRVSAAGRLTAYLTATRRLSAAFATRWYGARASVATERMSLPRRLTIAVVSGLVAATLALAVTGCGGDDQEAAETDAGPTGAEPASATPKLVGRWERVQTCRELAHALDQARLSAVAPSVLGDFFPHTSAREIARKQDPCAGAEPARPHSHFFTKDGAFGSVDNHGNQVDDGSYRVVDDHSFRIGPSRFDYRIVDGDVLFLHPVITAAARRRALSQRFEFNDAGWQVAVSYEGLPWKRVRCAGWC